MTAPHRTLERPESVALLVVTGEATEALLRRAAAIAARHGSDLQIYCPVVMPPAAHTGLSQKEPPWTDELSLARSQARRVATRVQSIANEASIDSHVETGVCHSMTEGVIEATGRVAPDLLLMPQTDNHALISKPFHAQHGDITPATDTPVWLLNRSEPRGSNVCAIMFPDTLSGRNRVEARRVIRRSASMAERAGAELHIVACVGQAPAIAVAREALAPSRLSIAQHREDRFVRRLYDLASSYAIPTTHVQLLRGNAVAALQPLLDPLGIGVAVTTGRPERRFGGLIKRDRVQDLLGLPCDLLILGDSDDTHA